VQILLRIIEMNLILQAFSSTIGRLIPLLIMVEYQEKTIRTIPVRTVLYWTNVYFESNKSYTKTLVNTKQFFV
jgi:hypothetical protein